MQLCDTYDEMTQELRKRRVASAYLRKQWSHLTKATRPRKANLPNSKDIDAGCFLVLLNKVDLSPLLQTLSHPVSSIPRNVVRQGSLESQHLMDSTVFTHSATSVPPQHKRISISSTPRYVCQHILAWIQLGKTLEKARSECSLTAIRIFLDCCLRVQLAHL
jgi:hypothetical protein